MADIIPILERTEKFNDVIPQAVALSMFYNAQVTTHLGEFGIHVASYVGCASIKAQDGHACLSSMSSSPPIWLSQMEPNSRNKFKFFNDCNIYENIKFFKL